MSTGSSPHEPNARGPVGYSVPNMCVGLTRDCRHTGDHTRSVPERRIRLPSATRHMRALEGDVGRTALVEQSTDRRTRNVKLRPGEDVRELCSNLAPFECE